MMKLERNVLLEKVSNYDKDDPRMDMVNDAEMSHEGITKDQKDEEQHSNVVLTRWLEKPKAYAEDESKIEFENPSGGI